MHAGTRRTLFSRNRIWVPTGIEQHEHRLDPMLVTNTQEGVETTLESTRVLLPHQVVQKDSHCIHAQTLRPSEFPINPFRIETVRLPQLKLVNRRRRDVV